jgi:hypothetical protein
LDGPVIAALLETGERKLDPIVEPESGSDAVGGSSGRRYKLILQRDFW